MLRQLSLSCCAAAVLWLPSYAAELAHGDWAIQCDNVKRCEAVGYGPERETERWIALKIVREAGPGTRLDASLIVIGSGPLQQTPLTVTIGERTLDGIRSNTPIAPGALQELLALMLDAQEGAVSDGRERWSMPMSGMKAVLLRTDEVQGRLGTPGALVQRGGRPEATVPPAPPLPVLRAAPRARRLDNARIEAALLAAINRREPRQDDDWTGRHSLFRLHDGRLLFVREAGRGASLSSYDVWLADARPPHVPRRLRLPLLGQETTIDLIDAHFDGTVLDSSGGVRSQADCGSATRWLWTGKGFALLALHRTENCRGLGDAIEHRQWVARTIPIKTTP